VNVAAATLLALAIVTIVLAWLVIEVRSLHATIGPLAGSPVARAVAGLGSSLDTSSA